MSSKLYLTGGVGAAGGHEGFGKPYELPNMQAYNETCASVGMDYWNHRQFLLQGDAKYIDIMERTLYQRPDLRCVARRQDLLLSEPARIERPARAQRMVRRRLLPRQHHALHGLRPRLHLRDEAATTSM